MLRLDPGVGASVWFRDHADPCMAALTALDGPFVKCSGTTHKLLPPLPMEEPPAYLRHPPASTPQPPSPTPEGTSRP